VKALESFERPGTDHPTTQCHILEGCISTSVYNYAKSFEMSCVSLQCRDLLNSCCVSLQCRDLLNSCCVSLIIFAQQMINHIAQR